MCHTGRVKHEVNKWCPENRRESGRLADSITSNKNCDFTYKKKKSLTAIQTCVQVKMRSQKQKEFIKNYRKQNTKTQ